MKNFIFTIFHHNYWVMLNNYSYILDMAIQNQLNDGIKFNNYDGYTVVANNQLFFVKNRPYGFMHYRTGLRPSRLTIAKFYDALDKYINK
jgi:hypothetical protein